MKEKILLSKLHGDAAILGETLVKNKKPIDEIIKAHRDRFGKSIWMIVDQYLESLETARNMENQSTFVAVLKKSYDSFPENFRIHADFGFFLTLFIAADSGFRRKIIVEYFNKVVTKKERIDENGLVGKINFEHGVEKAKQPALVAVKEEPVQEKMKLIAFLRTKSDVIIVTK